MSDWIDESDRALLTDLYELTMLQAYWSEGMHEDAVFSIFVRELPPERNFLLACGLESVLDYLERLSFPPRHLDYLRTTGLFGEPFLEWLGQLRFTGDVFALPEGTPVFGEEPILELIAPLPQAQVIETFVLNQVHVQTLIASKAARVVQAAAGRDVVDFGLRRTHGIDAGLKAARASWIAGASGTSNVLAGQTYGIPVTGTMAHSYIQAHADEPEAFRAFTSIYPDTVLLVDTYDTLAGVRNVIRLAREMGDDFSVRAIRLDSGDLAELARASRALLDEAGLPGVRIFASGGLDEHSIERLVSAGAPIDAFGVGTRMGVSADRPSLDIVYKLTEYAGRARTKLSTGKKLLPGRKQVFREQHDGTLVGDTIAAHGEDAPGSPLLRQVMRRGRRTDAGQEGISTVRERARAAMESLPPALRRLTPADPPYPVHVTPRLAELQRDLVQRSGAHRPGSRPPSGGDPHDD